MFDDLFNFRGINWWTLLGGLGLNYLISTALSFAGAFLAVNKATADFYLRYGAPLMVLAMFLACVLAGFIIGKIADDVPLKHALISSLGAVAPLVLASMRGLNPMLLMLALVAIAGNLNGGMLAMPRPKNRPPRNLE